MWAESGALFNSNTLNTLWCGANPISKHTHKLIFNAIQSRAIWLLLVSKVCFLEFLSLSSHSFLESRVKRGWHWIWKWSGAAVFAASTEKSHNGPQREREREHLDANYMALILPFFFLQKRVRTTGLGHPGCNHHHWMGIIISAVCLIQTIHRHTPALTGLRTVVAN